MKKLMTLALIGFMALSAAQTAAAASHDGDKGKGHKKGKPAFVDQKHRAHAEWKREKEYEKALKKRYKNDDDDRWDDRRNDERWERKREDERWEERRERERWEEQRRQESNRPLGEILREGVRTGKIEPRTPDTRRN